MTHVSLFSGIGGLDLAAEWAGFGTILQVESDPYCLKVLARNWPLVKRLMDIREVSSASVDGPVTVISGGFPCQPFSQAGKRGGKDDDRYLWPEMLRVIRELSPAYVVAENVSGLLSLNDGAEFELVCSDLERAGYEVLPFHYPAASVGAPHRRDRVFIVAHADFNRKSDGAKHEAKISRQLRDAAHSNYDRRGKPFQPIAELRGQEQANAGGNGKVQIVADPSIVGRSERYSDARECAARTGAQGPKERCGSTDHGWWETEPDVGRVAHGVPNRVDRLRALGNAVVPQQAYPIFVAIAEMERRFIKYGND